MYTRGIHTNKLVCFSHINLSFITGISAKNLEGQRENCFSLPYIYLARLRDIIEKREKTYLGSDEWD